MYRKITNCRICLHTEFDSILNLGMQSFTGIFPRTSEEVVPKGALELVKCKSCHLVQLAHSFEPTLLYGPLYGYRSGLNVSMVKHLQSITTGILEKYSPQAGDLIIDIGSNDSTMLQSYPEGKFKLIGIDPTGAKFKNYYPPSIQLIPDFFSTLLIRKEVGEQKAKVITSIAMFYDLEDPVGFAQEIADMLTDSGVWYFEQSYLPLMLDTCSYDTICHEHLEYYALKQIKRITDEVGLKIIDISTNSANGGSFAITVSKTGSPYPECSDKIQAVLQDEDRRGLSTLAPYDAFRTLVNSHREELVRLVRDLKRQGKVILGYGASTKGNVLLQYCGFTPADIPFIAEVNEDKFGSFTPGTRIPIISEKDARALKPDYFLVLPWHFHAGIIEREKEFLSAGGSLLLPLPRVETITC